MPLLDRLPDIDWSTLHHAYGPATDVPHLLRALVDPAQASAEFQAEAARDGRTVRDQVMWHLWGNVFHQGTRWQVTAHVVPFLVEILCDGPQDPQLSRFLLPYLHHLALGYPEHLFPQRFDPASTFKALSGKTDPGGEPDYHDDVLPLLWERDSYLAVEAAFDRWCGCMHAVDDDSALEAIALAGAFPRCTTVTVPILLDIVQSGSDQRKAHALVSLALLRGSAAFEDASRWLDADSRLVAICAACAALLADIDCLSPKAVELLVTPLGELTNQSSAHAGTVGVLVSRCLALMPAEHRMRAIEAVAGQHATATPHQRLSLSASMLKLAFEGSPAPRLAKDLTPEQRRAVATIRDHGAFTMGEYVFANYGNLIRSAGLPDSVEAIDHWLSGQATPPQHPRPSAKINKPWWKRW